MKSSTGHAIKQRKEAKDVFYTPEDLAKKCISIAEKYAKPDDLWFDGFYGKGVYYYNYPYGCEKDFTEIELGLDFFDLDGEIEEGVCCSNPPYSILDKVLQKTIELNPRVINYLIGVNNLTARRMEYMEKAGYFITDLHMCKVYKWYGMSLCVNWVKGGTPIMTYDRVVWKEPTKEEQDKLQLKYEKQKEEEIEQNSIFD